MRAPNESTHIIKYADDTVVLGLIDSVSEQPYFNAINYTLQWCEDNFLNLNVTKTKEMIHDFRQSPPDKKSVTIDSKNVEKVKRYKYLGCIIQEDLKWESHITSQEKKCNKRLFLMRQLSNLNVDSEVLRLYYNAMIASVLTYVIGAWYNSCGTTLMRKYQRIQKRATKLIRKHQHHLIITPASAYKTSATASTKKIIADEKHPLHKYFKWLPSGVRLEIPSTRTDRHRDTAVPSFIKLYNENTNRSVNRV